MADTPPTHDQEKLPAKHGRTLQAIYAKPTRSDLAWSAVVGLMKQLGATIDEARAGSRVAFHLKGKVFLIHKPHPKPVLSKKSLDSLRKFFQSAGVKQPK